MENLEVDIRRYPFKSYEELYNAFSWNIPERFNVGYAIIDRNVKRGFGDRISIYYIDDEGNRASYTFNELKRFSDSIASTLRDLGVGVGDVVGVYLQPRPELVATLTAVYRLGGIALSISPLIGTDGVLYRVRHSGAKVVVMEGSRVDVREKLKDVETLRGVFIVDDEARYDKEYPISDALKGGGNFSPVETRSEDPAQLFYTSGSTGPPKGVLHAHRFLLGHIPTYQLYFELAPREGDVYWTNADWGWIGALGDVVLPSLYFGMPVVAYRRSRGFSARDALEVMQEFKVTAAFITPTALRIIRREFPWPRRDFDLRLRAISTAGESPGKDLIEWGMNALGIPVNEFYGATESNLVVTNNSLWAKPGSLGKPAPGHVVDVVDDNGNPLPPGSEGYIAVKLPDPVVFLGYFKNPEATRERIRNGWFFIGDMGVKDEYGYLWFKGRADDVIKVSGYRIGPEEVEHVLLQYPAVMDVGVIGKPDPVRGTIIKAFIVLKPGYQPSDELKADIQNFVKSRLAAYAYPREIEFVNELPRTETGKLKRYELRRREIERMQQ
ncbi:AMP-binding protein [Vulcanisaeta thermophila]|uniref:AMP-binding protein n=1 Tax=Vulcanisaeta thermophila TaxID=867917 RepID=UPI000853AA4E|nr:AMP-binding protein [Vulcanisaeta thermophila]